MIKLKPIFVRIILLLFLILVGSLILSESFFNKLNIKITHDLFIQVIFQIIILLYISIIAFKSFTFWKNHKNHHNLTDFIIIKTFDKTRIKSIIMIMLLILIAFLYNFRFIGVYILVATFEIYFELPFLKKRFIKIKNGNLEDINNPDSKSKINEVLIYNGDIIIKTESHRSLVIRENELLIPKWSTIETLIRNRTLFENEQ